jgi:hypothetical protein
MLIGCIYPFCCSMPLDGIRWIVISTLESSHSMSYLLRSISIPLSSPDSPRMVPGWFSTYHGDTNMSFVYEFEASNQAYW